MIGAQTGQFLEAGTHLVHTLMGQAHYHVQMNMDTVPGADQPLDGNFLCSQSPVRWISLVRSWMVWTPISNWNKPGGASGKQGKISFIQQCRMYLEMEAGRCWSPEPRWKDAPCIVTMKDHISLALALSALKVRSTNLTSIGLATTISSSSDFDQGSRLEAQPVIRAGRQAIRTGKGTTPG
jgi:hypothetical protein